MHRGAANLDLAIASTDEFEQPVRKQSSNIAGPVTEHAGIFCRAAETSPGERLVPPITDGHRGAGNKDFSDFAGPDRCAVLANQFQLNVSRRISDWHRWPIKRRPMVYAP